MPYKTLTCHFCNNAIHLDYYQNDKQHYCDCNATWIITSNQATYVYYNIKLLFNNNYYILQSYPNETSLCYYLPRARRLISVPYLIPLTVSDNNIADPFPIFHKLLKLIPFQ